MKKILGISLVALFTAVPLMAGAETITVPAGVEETGNALTTQAYVKGAYNAALGQVRTVAGAVNTLNGTGNGSVSKSIQDNAAYATYDASDSAYTAGTIGYAIKNTTSAAVNALNATKSQDAASDNGWLQLQITQQSGVITGISGSIDGTRYDAAGAAATAKAEALQSVTDTLATYATTAAMSTAISDAVAAEATLRSNADAELQGQITTLNGNSSVTGSVDQKIATAISGVNAAASVADGHYISSSATIADNVEALDTAVYGLATTTVQVATAWGTEGEGVQNRAITALNSTVVVP